jgi:type VII secretion-associated serine protease mycosin
MLLRRSALAVVVPMVAGLGVAAGPAYADPNAADNRPVVEVPGPSKVRADQAAGYDPSSVLVRFKPAASAAARERALSQRGARVTSATAGGFVRATGTDAIALLARLRQDPAVESVTLDYRRRLAATPNDAQYAASQAYLKTVRLDKAWDLGKGATTEVIAVVDTGVLTTHPDLTGRTVAGYNAVAPGTAPTDTNGHGTMVAGIAAANTNNTVGIAGAAWTARVMPVKVFGPDGTALDSDVAEGIVWAADHGARIINLSLGGPAESEVLHDAVRYAIGKGAVVVAAAGNTGDGTPLYPAAYPEVLTVSATDHNGTFTDFSSWGSWVDVAAPGMKITSTTLGNAYAVGSGTSFAAPIVAGIAAIIRAKYPTWTPGEVVDRLTSRTRDAGPRGIDPYFGHGIVDAYRVLGGAWAADFAMRAPGAGEPNDVPARATALGASATGSIATEGDVDWYRHDTAAAGTITVTVTPSPYDVNRGQNFDPVLEVYDSGLRLLGRVDTPILGAAEVLTVTVGPGAQYVAVRNYNGALDARAYTVAVASTESGLFHPAQATGVGSAPAGVAVGDVNGDGLDDVLLTTTYANDPANDHKLVVFAQNFDGTLAEPVRSTPTQPSLAGSLAVLDADGDSYLDVALAGPAGVEILRQDGGALVNGPTISAAATTQIVAADMDADGDTDLVAAGGTGIRLLTQGADGSFTSSTVSADTTGELEIGTVDADTRPDVVGFSGGLVRVYHRTDSGFTRTEHDTSRAVGTTIAGIEVADVSGDGRDDVVASIGAASPNARLNVFRQTDTGTLAAPVVYTTRAMPGPVDAADVDGDGRLDVATVHNDGAASVLFQSPAGTLGAPVVSSLPSVSAHHLQGLAASDVDGDTRTDLVIADPASGLVVLRQATGPSVPGEAATVRDVTPADFATGAALTTAPRVTFQRPLDPTSVTTATVRLVHGRSGKSVATTPAYNATARTVTLTPAAPLQDNTPYRIVVAGLRDESGTDLTEGFTTTFQTVNQAPPALSSLWLGGGIDSANVTWPAPPITDLDQVVVRMAAGTTAPSSPTAGTAVYTGIGETVFVTGLTAGTTYTFAAWVRDRTGALSPVRTAVLVGTSLTGSVSATAVTKGRAVTVTGVLRRGTTTAIAGEPVRLDYRRKGTTEWLPLTTLTTDAAGRVSFAHTPAWTVEYRWRYRGSTTYLGVGGKTLTVTVR